MTSVNTFFTFNGAFTASLPCKREFTGEKFLEIGILALSTAKISVNLTIASTNTLINYVNWTFGFARKLRICDKSQCYNADKLNDGLH